MKNNKVYDGPDISAIIRDIANQNPIDQGKTDSPKNNEASETIGSIDAEFKGRLWEEFLECLNDPDDNPSDRTKLYAIDDDIVETLHQCIFGKPNVQVINSILRTFLIDNITRLREIHRPRSNSLLDKY